MNFAELAPKIGTAFSEDVLSPAKVLYSVDITISWADTSCRDLAIQGRIDSYNTFVFSPLEERVLVRNPRAG